MAMRVEDAGHFIGVYLVYLPLDLFDEEEVLNYGIDGDFSLRLDGVAGIDANNSLDPIFELGHLLP